MACGLHARTAGLTWIDLLSWRVVADARSVCMNAYRYATPNIYSTDIGWQLMHEPCFDTLRTKEQLGYTVVADARSSRGIVGYIFMVQSSNSTMAHVEARISAFIDVFAKTLREMDASEFETQRSALIARKLECDDSLNDEAERHWGELKVSMVAL